MYYIYARHNIPCLPCRIEGQDMDCGTTIRSAHFRGGLIRTGVLNGVENMKKNMQTGLLRKEIRVATRSHQSY